MNKYLERAKEIASKHGFLQGISIYSNPKVVEDEFYNAMCELTEEVEKEYMIELSKFVSEVLIKMNLNKNINIYTSGLIQGHKNVQELYYSKEQVEKLLQKQRESDSKSAYYYDTNGNKISCENEVLENELINF